MHRFAVLTAALVLAVAIQAAEAPPAAPAGDAAAVLREYFAAPDATVQAALAAKFGPLAPKDFNGLKALLHQAAPFPEMAPGTTMLKTKGDDVVPPVSYVLRIPTGYKAAAGRAWPLIIACHGTGGSGAGMLKWLESVLGPDADNYILACPDSPAKEVYKISRVNTEYPVRVLEDVRFRANVDSDRAILAGVSKGGYTAWGTVLFSPGQWGGAAPVASWPLTETWPAGATFYLPNVVNLPIQAHWGANDIEPGQKVGISTYSRDVSREFLRIGPKAFEGIEYAGQGHALAIDAEKLRKFCASARRNPYPKSFKYIFHHLWQGQAYFVRAVALGKDEFDFNAPHIVPAATLAELARAERALYLKEAFEITVSRQGGGTIALTTKNLAGVEAAIGPEDMDSSHPVKVTVNGHLVGNVKAVDWALLLETARKTYDFERLVAGRIEAEHLKK